MKCSVRVDWLIQQTDCSWIQGVTFVRNEYGRGNGLHSSLTASSSNSVRCWLSGHVICKETNWTAFVLTYITISKVSWYPTLCHSRSYQPLSFKYFFVLFLDWRTPKVCIFIPHAVWLCILQTSLSLLLIFILVSCKSFYASCITLSAFLLAQCDVFYADMLSETLLLIMCQVWFHLKWIEI